MATEEECAAAFDELAKRLANAGSDVRQKADFDRTLSCRLTDLGVVFAGRLRDGTLQDIHRSDSTDAQLKLAMSSDDLIAMVDGTLSMFGAWTQGRLKIDASVLDLLRLRSVF